MGNRRSGVTTMDPFPFTACFVHGYGVMAGGHRLFAASTIRRARQVHPKQVLWDERLEADPFPLHLEMLQRVGDSEIISLHGGGNPSYKEASESLTPVFDWSEGTFYSASLLLDFSIDYSENWERKLEIPRPRENTRSTTLSPTLDQRIRAPTRRTIGHPRLVLFPVTSPVLSRILSSTHDRLAICSLPELQAIAKRQPKTSKPIPQTNAHGPQTHRHELPRQPFGPQEWRINSQTTKTSIGSIISSYRKTQSNHNQKATSQRCSPRSISTTLQLNNKASTTQTNSNSTCHPHNSNKTLQQSATSMIYGEKSSATFLNKLQKTHSVKSHPSPTQQQPLLLHPKDLSSYTSPHLASLLQKRRTGAASHPPIHSDSDSPKSISWIAMLGQLSRTLDSLLRPPPSTNPLLLQIL